MLERDIAPIDGVLVVEDDASQRELITRILRRMGVRRTRGVADGASVFQAVVDFDPAVIVMDLHLGVVDGFDVLVELAERDAGWAHRAVVVLTGDTDPAVQARLSAIGIGNVVHKPYQIDEFIAVVEALLARPSAEGGSEGGHDPDGEAGRATGRG